MNQDFTPPVHCHLSSFLSLSSFSIISWPNLCLFLPHWFSPSEVTPVRNKLPDKHAVTQIYVPIARYQNNICKNSQRVINLLCLIYKKSFTCYYCWYFFNGIPFILTVSSFETNRGHGAAICAASQRGRRSLITVELADCCCSSHLKMSSSAAVKKKKCQFSIFNAGPYSTVQ